MPKSSQYDKISLLSESHDMSALSEALDAKYVKASDNESNIIMLSESRQPLQ
jgi:hypothetical protein